MGVAWPFLMSAVAAYGIAIVAWALVNAGRAGSVLGGVASGLILACPLLIPPEWAAARGLVALPCVDLFLKILDRAREVRRGGRGGRDFRALSPFPGFLAVVRERDRRLAAPVARGPEVARFVVGLAGFAACVAAAMSGVIAAGGSFAADHAIRFVLFVATVESASRAMQGLERLSGYDIAPIVRSCFLARSPREFWARYNTRVHSWLEWNVFRPSGGRESPIRRIMACFFASAILHELMFDLALSRIDGSQFVFFMIQAPAVLGSPRLERFARRHGAAGDALARGFTILWMSATSILFFRGVGRIFQFLGAGEAWPP